MLGVWARFSSGFGGLPVLGFEGRHPEYPAGGREHSGD